MNMRLGDNLKCEGIFPTKRCCADEIEKKGENHGTIFYTARSRGVYCEKT